MAVKNCPDCGGLVSTSASTCPHCGRPMSSVIKIKIERPHTMSAIGSATVKGRIHGEYKEVWKGECGQTAIIQADEPIVDGRVDVLLGSTDPIILYPGKSYKYYQKKIPFIGWKNMLVEVDAII